MTKPAIAQRASPPIVATNDDAAIALPLTAAARRVGHSYLALKREIEAERPRIRHIERRRHGRGLQYLVRLDELRVDLERLPRCPIPGCEEPGLGKSGHCGAHFAAGGRERARLLERSQLKAPRDWLTLTQAAMEAGRPRTTLKNSIDRGELSAERIGRHLRIRRSELVVWLAEHPTPARSQRPTPAQRARNLERTRGYHAAGLQVHEIADRLDVSAFTARRYLDELGLPRPGAGRKARRLAAPERAARQAAAAELYRGGASLRQVAAQVLSSPTQVRRDLASAQVETRPTGRQAKYPEPTERDCLRCGRSFTPQFPAQDTRAGETYPRRYCTDECARAARREARQDALDALLGVPEAAARLGVGERRVWTLIARGLLAARMVAYEGQLRPAWGIEERELARFERAWVRGAGHDDGRRLLWRNPDRAVAQLERMGVLTRKALREGSSLDDVRTLEHARLAARAKRLTGRGRGRKPSDGPPRHWLVWQAKYDELKLELDAAYLQDPAAFANRPPSREYICLAVAEWDWLNCPDRWPRDAYPPHRFDEGSLAPRAQSAASDTVRRALDRLKRLQNAGTVKAAA
jgi:excisionase family DNA binding protein